MKCPKCGYLGFEAADRCRNCGYDFSLSSSVAPPELPLRLDSSAAKPIEDLSLAEPSPADGAPSVAAPSPDANRPTSWASKVDSELLPLFGADVPEPDDEPLITKPSAPRAPLAVRRSTPDMPRLRADQPRPQTLDLPGDEPPRGDWRRDPPPMGADGAGARGRKEPAVQAAGVLARLVAVAIDLIVLGVVDALVIYFTLRICGLTVQDVAVLPKGPLIAFLLAQNGGYLVAFTVGGQTLGKMAAGIRVIAAEPELSVGFGHAFVRELTWLLLAAPAGLGFLPVLFSRDRRGLHDRLAGTRVVR
jgi:uncharacterized RDD family membrane protein YckC